MWTSFLENKKSEKPKREEDEKGKVEVSPVNSSRDLTRKKEKDMKTTVGIEQGWKLPLYLRKR